MKYSQFLGFEKHLQASSPSNFSTLYLVLAKEESERKLALMKIRAQFEKYLHASWQSFDAKEDEESVIFTELETLSFLEPYKAVHIQEVQALKKHTLERLENFFAKPPSGLYIVLSGSDLKSHPAFFKKVEKHGIVLEVNEKPWEKEKNTQEWLIKEAEKQEKILLPNASQLLVKALGCDAILLLAELNKVICYVGERKEIAVDDVRAIASFTHQENSFQLADAIFKRNAPQAFRIAKGILSQETPFFVLLRQIRTQFQTAYQIISLQGQSSLKEEFPHLKETAIERYYSQAKEYGYSHFIDALRIIDQIEFMAKNGEDRYDFLSDFLIVKLISL